MMYVYQIVNEKTLNSYIGSSTSKWNGRFNKHKFNLRRGKHDNKKMQSDFNLHGESSFSFEWIEYYNTTDRDFMLMREQHYLDILKPTYNISKSAYSSKGVKKSQELKDRVRKTIKDGYSSGRLVWDNEAARKRVIKYFSENKFKEETKKKLALIKQKKKIYCYDGCTLELIKIFDTSYDCRKELGYTTSQLYTAIRGPIGFSRDYYLKQGEGNPLNDLINYNHGHNNAIIGVYDIGDLSKPLRVYKSRMECAKNEEIFRRKLSEMEGDSVIYKGLLYKHLNYK